MPERRRKNKNKRKNKNNRTDNNNKNSEVIKKESEESCSAQIDNNEKVPECEESYETVVAETSLNQNVSAINENIPEIVCDVVCVNEDVNNNSSTRAIETLPLSVPQLKNVEDGNIEVQESDTYIVESPEQSFINKPKLNNKIKSKSLDNDDTTNIVDVTEDGDVTEDNTVSLVDTSNIIVSDVESDIEWEKIDELQNIELPPLDDIATGTLSITTVPLNVAQCQEINISLTPDVETSLRNYLRTLDLSTNPENVNSVEIKAEIEQIINREIKHRLRKKGLADDFGLQRLGPPRTLDVIDEEGSGDSSKSSRRQSYLSDKKSDNEDLEDDVFEDKNKTQEKMARRTETTFHKKTFGRLVPQQCMLVGAKILEPEVTEARGDWTVQTVQKITGAEVVYLTDSSSSTSSLHDYEDETDDGMETDVSVRMITPTIEVTDTENLLKNTFISQTNDQNKLKKIQENKRNEHLISVDYKNETEEQKNTKSVENTHEIIVLSTDNIKTNLYVKDVESVEVEKNILQGNEEQLTNSSSSKNIGESTQKTDDKYDLEIKVLKCELNDAINNLIKEVSDSEINENTNEAFVRQDSSSSVCSSQCTAKYNPTSSSLNDVSNILPDETSENNKLYTDNSEAATAGSHVKDVFEHIAGDTTEVKDKVDVATKGPSHLRDLCVKRIAAFPFGDKILEELASVSKRIQNIAGAYTIDNTASKNKYYNLEQSTTDNKIPSYSLPDVTPIRNVVLPAKFKEPVPPPVQPRNSSLKKKSREEEGSTGVPTKTEPVYVCLSPSQKMLIEKTNTDLSKEAASELADVHKKYVDRRGHAKQFTNDKQKDETGNDDSPIVSFKSQTGSRLLALICDPSVTSNINTYNKHISLDQLEKKYTMSQTTTAPHHNRNQNLSNTSTFRPIPPPRPKKMASSFYESDESSDFTDSSMRSMKSERKFFHFSTGHLNKEIEEDISSIQNMHRYYTNTRDSINEGSPRRPSLPKDLCDQQMEYIRQKEKEVEAEIHRLESIKKTLPSSPQKMGPRAPLISDKEVIDERVKDSNNYFVSKRRDFFASLSAPEHRENIHSNVSRKHEKGRLSSLFSSSQEELLREKMYSEYVTQMAQREERKQHKVIKITNTLATPNTKISKSMPSIDVLDAKINNRIEKEFISKARERWDKLGIKDPETEDERDLGNNTNNVYREPKVIEHKIKVIEGGQEKDVGNLPRHLQEFVRFTAKEKEQRTDSSGESKSGPASPHVMIWCAVVIIVLAVGKYFLRLLRNK